MILPIPMCVKCHNTDLYVLTATEYFYCLECYHHQPNEFIESGYDLLGVHVAGIKIIEVLTGEEE